MARHTILLDTTVDLPVERVFDVFADHRRFGKLLGAPIKKVDASPVPGDPNGVGSVRHIGVGPVSFQEEVTRFERPELIEYKVIQGGPIKNHAGRIEFKALEQGCQVTYRVEFDPKVPMTGGVIEKALRDALGKALKKLPKVA
jgi:uncharacterized protein YndB with AHSA1/START domain